MKGNRTSKLSNIISFIGKRLHFHYNNSLCINSPFANRKEQPLLKGLKSFFRSFLGLPSNSPAPCNVTPLCDKRNLIKSTNDKNLYLDTSSSTKQQLSSQERRKMIAKSETYGLPWMNSPDLPAEYFRRYV